MVVFFIKFWEGLKKIVIGIVATIIFFGGALFNDLKRTYTNFSTNVKLLWKYIVTGNTGDLMVKPSLISVIIYIFFSSKNSVDPIKDPGDYSVALIGWKGSMPSNGLIELVADYQQISNVEAQKILLLDNMRIDLAYGIKETRVAELKKQFEDADAILEIIRIGIDENVG